MHPHYLPRVVFAKLTYAWWGFTTAADRQRLKAVIRRGVHSGLCDLYKKDGYRQQNLRQRQKLISRSIIDYDVRMTFY